MQINKFTDKFPSNLKYLIRIYILSLSIFFVLRCAFAFANFNQLADTPLSYILQSFIIGLRFDIAVTGYFVILPFVLALIAGFLNPRYKFLKEILFVYYSIILTLMIILLSVNIPFYMHFNTQLNTIIFQWLATPVVVAGLLFQTPGYYIYLTLLIIVIAASIYVFRKIHKKWLTEHQEEFAKSQKVSIPKTVLLYVITAFLLVLGIRSSFEKFPISWGDASFSPYQFANTIALNPVFSFIRSVIDANSSRRDPLSPKFMNDSLAIGKIREYYNTTNNGYESPVARLVKAEGTQKKYNIVLVMMESISSGYIGSSNFYKPSITPYFDTLMKQGIYFPRMYSAGTHTFNAIEAILMGLPALPEGERSVTHFRLFQAYPGMSYTLFKNGYQTMFVCSHYEKFDNVRAIVSTNGFENFVSGNDFKSSEKVSIWGPPDHVIFDYSIQRINKLAETGKPFFTTILTMSNHEPFVIPNAAKNKIKFAYNDIKHNIIEYADWSVRDFLDKASTQPWFDNTLFLFVGDHGKNIFPYYETNIWYNHVPFLIYAPKIIKQPQVIDKLANQTDIFPTIMDFLNFDYVNNTFGINLFKQSRPYAIFTADMKIAAVSDKYFYVDNGAGKYLYDYSAKNLDNLLSASPDTARSMSDYLNANLEVVKWLILNRKLHYIKPN